jgi:fluoride exporter
MSSTTSSSPRPAVPRADTFPPGVMGGDAPADGAGSPVTPSRFSGRALAAVAAGGALGATLRHAFLVAFPPVPGAFPATIFVENVVGAFLLGLVATLLLERWRPRWDLRPFLCTGLLGSFTTFSNVSLDLWVLGTDGRAGVALIYAGASVVAGLAAAVAGMVVARRVSGGSGGGAWVDGTEAAEEATR